MDKLLVQKVKINKSNLQINRENDKIQIQTDRREEGTEDPKTSVTIANNRVSKL